MENKKKAIIVKSPELLLAHYDLSATAQKLLMLCIDEIRKDMEKDIDSRRYDPGKQNTFTFSTSMIREALDVTGWSLYERLHEYGREMMGTSFRIEDPETQSFVMIAPFPMVRYNYNGNRKFEITINEQLNKHLFGLSENAPMYLFENVNQLKKYSIRLYEIFIKHLNEGVTSFTYEFDELRVLLGLKLEKIEGNSKKLKDVSKYPRPSSLDQKILDPCREDLEAHSNISYTYECTRKRGADGKYKHYYEFNVRIIDRPSVDDDVPMEEIAPDVLKSNYSPDGVVAEFLHVGRALPSCTQQEIYDIINGLNHSMAAFDAAYNHYIDMGLTPAEIAEKIKEDIQSM